MKIPVASRHMTTLALIMFGVLILLASFYSRNNHSVKPRTSSDTATFLESTRSILASLNSKLNYVINAKYDSNFYQDPAIQAQQTGDNDNSSHRTQNQQPPQQEEHLPPVLEDGAILINRRVADDVSRHVRLLCWIPTREKYVATRLKAVQTTWARRCDKTLYFMTNPSNKSLDVITMDIPDIRQTLTDKTVYAHTYLYKHYLDDFDWFLKADDDTYVIVENLKFLLSKFNQTTPGYIGSQFKHFAPQGYMSGGAGYALNAMGIKTIVENGYQIPGRCRLKGGAEDIETGRCAYKAGISTFNQLDVNGKQTFFATNVYAYALGPTPLWAKNYMRATVATGLSCCSPLLVSFHYTGVKLMYVTEFLLYKVVVHGRQEMLEKADSLFDGSVANDMDIKMRRRAYPGETLQEYYEKGWRDKNTTIYINPNLKR